MNLAFDGLDLLHIDYELGQATELLSHFSHV